MDAALRKVLRAGRRPSGCDAEMAAAWAEGRLKGVERERFEGHIAGCTDCRALATAMLEELAPERPAPAPAPLWSSMRWRWAVPATAGVLMVGSAVYFRRPEPPVQKAAEATQVRAVADQEVERQVAAAPGPAAPAVRQPPRLRRDDAVPAAAAPVSVAEGVTAREERAGSFDRREADELRKVAADKPASGVIGGVAGEPAQSFRGTRAQQLQALEQGKNAAYLLPGGAPLRAVARSGNRIWAVSDGGQIFRSLDAGQTWEKLASPTDADLILVELESETSLVVGDKAGTKYKARP